MRWLVMSTVKLVYFATCVNLNQTIDGQNLNGDTTMRENPSIYHTAVFKAVELSGSIAELAKKLGVSRQVIYVWIRQGFVPLRRAIQIEEIFGIPRVQLIDPVLHTIFSDGTVSEQAMIAYRPYAPT